MYLSSITNVLKAHGKEYTNDLRVKVMGTIPINTATIIIKELELDMEPEELNEEFYNNQIKNMEKVPFLPGLNWFALQFIVDVLCPTISRCWKVNQSSAHEQCTNSCGYQ